MKSDNREMVWIYVEFRNRGKPWRLLPKDSPELRWEERRDLCGKGQVVFRERSSSDWQYVYFGSTQEEVCSYLNGFRARRIEGLKRDIASLEESMVKPQKKKGERGC